MEGGEEEGLLAGPGLWIEALGVWKDIYIGGSGDGGWILGGELGMMGFCGAGRGVG